MHRREYSDLSAPHLTMIIINIVSITVNMAGAVIPLSDKIKIISATLDANLTMAPHIRLYQL